MDSRRSNWNRGRSNAWGCSPFASGAALVGRKRGMEAVFEDSVFLVAHDSYVGTLSDSKGKFLIERAAGIAFQI